MPLRVMSIGGTRPEAIKLAPLARILARTDGIEHILVATGQHEVLFQGMLDPFGVVPDIDLRLPNTGMDAFCAALESALPGLFRAFSPDLVLVQGDTSSAWAAARAAHRAGIAIGHVEAGLRSGNADLPWPEERNRRAIDAISTLLFAPSRGAAANLAGMPGRIHVTGNTGIDAMRFVRDRQPARLHRAPRAGDPRTLLVTCHRREAIPHLPGLLGVLDRLALREDVIVRLPVHPNPAVGEAIRRFPRTSPRLILDAPYDYAALLRMMETAHLLLTDSGGLQEEAPALGLPTLVLRDVTERPEPIASGNAVLTGLDPERIHTAAARLLDDPAAYAAMAHPTHPYGDGRAAVAITDAILAWAALPVELRSAFP